MWRGSGRRMRLWWWNRKGGFMWWPLLDHTIYQINFDSYSGIWRSMRLRKKCIFARACAHMQQYKSFFAMKQLQSHLEPCTSIVQAVVAARPTAVSTKPVTRCLSLKKSVQIHASSWQTRSPLRCRTSIIQSSALVQASSSLSISRTRACPQSSPSTKFYFRHGFRGLFQICHFHPLPLAPFFRHYFSW